MSNQQYTLTRFGYLLFRWPLRGTALARLIWLHMPKRFIFKEWKNG